MKIYHFTLSCTLSLILLLLAQISVCNAQEALSVTPSNGIINASFIEPYVNKWNVYVKNPDGQESLIRIWTDYTQVLSVNGAEMLHRVQDLYGPDHSLQQTWINVVERVSLKPYRFSLYTTGGGYQEIEFQPDSVSYRFRNQSGELHSEWMKTDHSFFDWNLYGILLAGLPFEEGNFYHIPFWSQNSRMVENLTVEIGAVEKVETDSGRDVNARRVSTDRRLTFWLVKSPPYVIGLRLAMENGSHMIWRMAES